MAAYQVYVGLIGQKPGPMLDDYAALVAKGVVHVLDDGELRGIVVLLPEGDTMLLDNVAVSPVAQGLGYGKALLAFAEHHAIAMGCRAIRLYTNVLMTGNISAYGKLGYVETHRAMQDGFSRVFMRKVLM